MSRSRSVPSSRESTAASTAAPPLMRCSPFSTRSPRCTTQSEEQFRELGTVIEGMPLIGSGGLGSRVWSSPAITVIGIDVQSGGTQGLRVAAVVPGGPAASAGLRVGDIIMSIDGEAAVSTDQLMAVTLATRAGDRVQIGYERSGSRGSATIILVARQ